MAHIELNSALPGIVGLFEFRKETAEPLRALADTLLRGPSPLSTAEREIIAAYVSWLNDCSFCFRSHGAAAAALLGTGVELLDDIAAGLQTTAVSPRIRALLQVAAKVRERGPAVTSDDIAAARAAGANDVEIHDTVLIAAAFCMFNRYVDGLSTWAPPRNEDYLPMGVRLAEQGYLEIPDEQ
jgi:uncharacterized peroxidase-related enzyme